MPALLTIDSLSAATPDGTPLFHDLTLSLGAEHVGLVGRNGSGKSTLLRIVAGDAVPASGSVTLGGSIGMLDQHWPEELRASDVLAATTMLDRLARLAAGEGSEDDLAEADWTLEPRIEVALAETGLTGIDLARKVATLSGGERTRVALARLLLDAPDLLLLDEPTNNLDADGRAAIAALLAGWRGGVLVATHDRALLEHMDRIVELTPLGARIFGGGWSAFVEARAAERARAQAELVRAGDAVRNTAAAVQQQHERKARRDKAGRAFAAKGSEPKILLGRQAERAENSVGRDSRVADRQLEGAADRLEAARAGIEILTPLTIDVPPTGLATGRRLLSFDRVTVVAGDRALGPWSFTIAGPAHVAVAGANGAGKTSLLRTAIGEIAPETGTIDRAEGRLAMLDQHVALLDPARSILDNFRRIHPGATEREAHAACARFAFRNRDALRLAGTLSGGERLRAGLACILGGTEPPWLLLLDEPTNHLDLESIEILEAALRAYDGALLVVSHDPAFLTAIGIDQTIALV